MLEAESNNLSLIKRWVNEISPALETREEILLGLKNRTRIEGEEAILDNGIVIPSFLVPTMSLWAKRGPEILCSYCHPEEFDLYTFVAQLNLVQFIRGLGAKGFNISKERVVENWYETIALNESSVQPLNFGGIMPKDKLKADILGISSYKFGSEVVNLGKQRDIMLNLEREIPQISQTIVDRFSQELDDTIKEKLPSLTRRQRYETRQDEIKNLISRRLMTTTSFVDEALSRLSLKFKPTVNDLLFDVEQQFGGFVFDSERRGVPRKMSQVIGIEGKLSSENQEYFNLVTDTLSLLVEAKGPEVLKALVNSTGDGLFFGFIEGKNLIVTVDKNDNSFILMSTSTGETERTLVDSEVLGFVRQNKFVPLAKSEMLAIVSGGVTLHMGSEHGNREKVLKALKIDQTRFGPFTDYLRQLRIGADLEQGSEPFLLDGTKAMPAILAFVLFGQDSLRQMLISRVGADSLSVSLTEKEIKKLAAESLVGSLSKKRDLVRAEFVHGGYLWGFRG